jgi:hypothetical protein
MWFPKRIFRPNREVDAAEQQTIRDALTNSIQILRSAGQPDSFLRRKTQEPFPKEDEGLRIDQWLNSKELRPPK